MSAQAAESLTPEQIKAGKDRQTFLVEELNRFRITRQGDRLVKDMSLPELEHLYIRERIFQAKMYARRIREEELLGY
ncbi:hypothetical protein [Terribacillus sp. 7520-G]|uniref:hypothetical protein n=1 Tax=Terribacillus TaxID=459532 RepID=UPI000BA69AAF|nr:hypothetical protein [Terribacillus sp. 7520-G]PAD38279.1 hypothetical protein CHH53_11945 [Terribacillus sp. 7520-G]